MAALIAAASLKTPNGLSSHHHARAASKRAWAQTHALACCLGLMHPRAVLAPRKTALLIPAFDFRGTV
jgi:hypothetical protein